MLRRPQAWGKTAWLRLEGRLGVHKSLQHVLRPGDDVLGGSCAYSLLEGVHQMGSPGNETVKKKIYHPQELL